MVESFFNISRIMGNTLARKRNKVIHAIGEELWWLLVTPLPTCCFHLHVTIATLALKVILKFGEDPKVAGLKIRTLGRMRQNVRKPQALQSFLSFLACVRTSIFVVKNCLFNYESALQSGPESLKMSMERSEFIG